MDFLTNAQAGELWFILLCLAVAIAAAALTTGVLFAWRKRPVDEEALPHCNLEERLAQIAKAGSFHTEKPA